MHYSYPYESSEIAETDLYQDLSSFIKILKELINNIDSILQYIQNNHQYSSLLAIIKVQTNSHHDLINKYNFTISDKSMNQVTYHRFVCRLIEITGACRKRFAQKHQEFHLYNHFIGCLSYSINSYKINKNIGQIFKNILANALKFCLGCEMLNDTGSIEKALDFYVQKKSETKTQEGNQQSYFKKNFYSNTETHFKRTMNDINKRFLTLSCLDIDYYSFKGTFYKSKSDKDDLYQDYIQRNYLIFNQVYKYSKDFKDYLKRRQRAKEFIEARKNRFQEKIKTQTHINNNRLKIGFHNSHSVQVKQAFDRQKQSNMNKEHNQLYKTQINQKFNQYDKSFSKYNLNTETNNSLNERKKIKYHIKNIFLNINKVKNNKYNKNMSNNRTRTNDQFILNRPKIPNFIKGNKFSVKSSKFIDKEEIFDDSAQRPVLDIRKWDYQYLEVFSDNKIYAEQQKKTYQTLKKHKSPTNQGSNQTSPQSKNLRIVYLMNRTIVNSKKLKTSLGQSDSFAKLYRKNEYI